MCVFLLGTKYYQSFCVIVMTNNLRIMKQPSHYWHEDKEKHKNLCALCHSCFGGSGTVALELNENILYDPNRKMNKYEMYYFISLAMATCHMIKPN